MTAIFIYYTPSWQSLADIVLPVAQAYCDKHGYAKEFVCEAVETTQYDVYISNDRYGNFVSPLPVGYYKIVKLRELLNKYHLIWVLDLDAMITSNTPFTSFIAKSHDPVELFFTEDIHGINAGSFIIRSTPNTKSFVDQVINNFDAPEEQTVMKRYLHMVKVGILPQPSINSYLYTEYLNNWADKVGDYPMPTHEQGQWKWGDLCLHLPGVDYERRIEIFKQIKEQL